MVCRIRDSSTFAAGQRSEIDDTGFLGRCRCQVSVLGRSMKTFISLESDMSLLRG